MKWLDPKALLTRFFIIWLLLVTAWILFLSIVMAVVHYWCIVLLVAGLIGGIWFFLWCRRRRFDRW